MNVKLETVIEEPLIKKPKQLMNKRFTCVHCDSAFTTLANLQNHNIAIHEKLKPFQCDHCSFSCSRQDNLVSHVKNKHAPKNLSCDQCPGTFISAKKEWLLLKGHPLNSFEWSLPPIARIKFILIYGEVSKEIRATYSLHSFVKII